MDANGNETGIKLPYVITVSQAGNKVLSIRRNYKAEDPKKNKNKLFVQFKFLPGTGFYGFWFNTHDWWINKNCNSSS